jgi:hypothetical protein
VGFELVKAKEAPEPVTPEQKSVQRYTVHFRGDELQLESDGSAEVWRRAEK